MFLLGSYTKQLLVKHLNRVCLKTLNWLKIIIVELKLANWVQGFCLKLTKTLAFDF